MDSLVRVDELRRWLTSALERLGWPPVDAEQVAEVYLDSELRGHESHGVFLFSRLLDNPGDSNPRPEVKVVRETQSALLLDGDCSQVVADVRAMRWCIERARATQGIAVAAVRRSQPIVPGFYARMAAEAGLIGFACTNATPMVAPPGGRTPTLGTNPFAYAFPAGRHPPLVLDMATTTTAAFTARLAAEEGRSLPLGTVLDHEGAPTTDAAEFLRGGLMAPLGSPAAPYKGFGLALVIDALAGVLSGGAFARDVRGSEPSNLFWALDPEAFLPRDEFLTRMDAQIDQIKAGERLPGVDELLAPGERGQRRYDGLTSRGTVPLSAAAWHVVENVSAALSVQRPPIVDQLAAWPTG